MAIHPDGPKQKSREVLVAFLRIHDSVIAGMAAVHKRSWTAFAGSLTVRRPVAEHRRIRDSHQSVAHRSDRQARDPHRLVVILVVRADQTEEAVWIESAVKIVHVF